MIARRDVLTGLGALGAAALLPGRIALAAAPTDRRLVLVILRGGLDGLAAVPPYADENYRRLRPNIAVARPGAADGALDLDGYFGLHPALKTLHTLYREKRLAIVPAFGGRSEE
ncbi:MAG: hypothetical protein AB7G15_16680, partial [Alphaproteobacteria bacterium]